MTCSVMGCSLCPHALFLQARSHMYSMNLRALLIVYVCKTRNQFFERENLFDGKVYIHQCFLVLGSIAVIHNKIIYQLNVLLEQ